MREVFTLNGEVFVQDLIKERVDYIQVAKI